MKLVETLEERKYSFRDLDNLIDYSRNYYLNDIRKQAKKPKFSFDYLERAQEYIGVTDGESASFTQAA